jgi:shikimate 5-dehydrogenase
MEAYPEQPTVSDLENIYHYRAVERATRLVGVTGSTELATATIAGLNAAFAQTGGTVRCLPLEVGDLRLFRKVLEAVKLACAVIDEEHRESMREVALELDPSAERAGAADLIVPRGGSWQGYYAFDRAAATALESVLRERKPGDTPLAGRIVIIVGTNGLARAMAWRVKKQGGNAIIASRDKVAAQAMAQEIGCRHTQLDAVYTTLHDVLVVCAEEQRHARLKSHSGEVGLHAGYLKPSITVMDLTTLPRPSELLQGAAERGCPIVPPRCVLVEHVVQLAKLIAGKDAAVSEVQKAIDATLGEEE